MTLKTLINVSVIGLLVATSLCLDLAWNSGSITTGQRFWWQPRLVAAILVLIGVQCFFRWHEGGYAMDATRDRQEQGFEVIQAKKDKK